MNEGHERQITEDGGHEEFAYFMIRVRRSASATEPIVSGVVERLGAGEKREFRDGAELLRTLSEWPEAAAGQRATHQESAEPK